jgi:predicted nuclease of predicted toxin-antitoxin system
MSLTFLANENFPKASILILREKAITVISVTDEMKGAKDTSVLQRANKENAIILTFDRDYGELIYKNKLISVAGVVCYRLEDDLPHEAAEILLDLLDNPDIKLFGFYTVVERDKIRQRRL